MRTVQPRRAQPRGLHGLRSPHDLAEDSGGWSGRPGRGQRSSGTPWYNLPAMLLFKPKSLQPPRLEAQDAGNVCRSAAKRKTCPDTRAAAEQANSSRSVASPPGRTHKQGSEASGGASHLNVRLHHQQPQASQSRLRHWPRDCGLAAAGLRAGGRGSCPDRRLLSSLHAGQAFSFC